VVVVVVGKGRGSLPRPLPPLEGHGDDDIEIDYNSAIAHMPDHVQRAVIELARPYLED